MKYIVIAGVAACLTLSAAQIEGLPECATSCVQDSIPEDCGETDAECICSSDSFIEEMSCCISENCEQEDQETTLGVARLFCTAAGVDDLPDSASCASDSEETGGAGANTASGTEGGEPTNTAEETDSEATPSSDAEETDAQEATSTGEDATSTSDEDDPEATESNSANGLVAQGMGIMGFAALGAAALV